MFRIEAIGVYKSTGKSDKGFHQFECIKAAKNTNYSLFFSGDPLKELQTITLKYVENFPKNKINCEKVNGQYHYLKQSHNDPKHLLTLVSNKEIYSEELNYLFRNIEHAVYRESTKVSLQLIMSDTRNFIGRDILIDKAQEKIEAVKVVMNETIDKALKTGDKLHIVEIKAEQLNLEAEKFDTETQKLRRCC